MPTAHIEHAVFVDLETTGATATHDRITEVGIVEMRDDEIAAATHDRITEVGIVEMRGGKFKIQTMAANSTSTSKPYSAPHRTP